MGGGGVKSEQCKKARQREVLASWRVQRERRVKSAKEGERVRDTHFLQCPERVRTPKSSQRARGTHPLENAEGGTSQSMKRSWIMKATHLLDAIDGGTSQDSTRDRPRALTCWRA
jgi:hypothetical protein